MNLISGFYIALAMGLLQSIASTPTQTNANQATFSAKLFGTIAQEKINENVIISPASIQTCLALAYIGAKGTTADELRSGLHLGNSDVSKEKVAQQFGNLLSKMRNSTEAIVKMANRIYVKQGYQISHEFNDLAQRYFESAAENVDFSDNVKTAEKINNWIEQQTENKIRNLISPDVLDDETAAVLVNAIYFKAKWWNKFDYRRTAKKDFRLSKTSTKQVDMMHQQDQFGYAELSDLDAKAISMTYIFSDIKLLVLLPNHLDGLGQLEQQLKDVDLTKLLAELHDEEVTLAFPKFKIEFDISLKPILEALGMRELFSSAADFSGFLSTNTTIAVSEVKHKAFIEVDEKGTESAGGTSIKVMHQSLPLYQFVYDFNVDHPFYFALLDNDTIYFAGHVADI